MEKLNDNNILISRQFMRIQSDGQMAHSFGEWEELPDSNKWEFIEQFLPDYQWNTDVTLSDDLSCIIDGEDDWTMEKFLHYHPQYEEYTIEQLIEELKRIEAQSYNEAKNGFQEAINNGVIKVREFPVKIVSAKSTGDGKVLLQQPDAYYRSDENPDGWRYSVNEFQNVQSRVVDGQFQVRNPQEQYTPQQWLSANSSDFE